MFSYRFCYGFSCQFYIFKSVTDADFFMPVQPNDEEGCPLDYFAIANIKIFEFYWIAIDTPDSSSGRNTAVNQVPTWIGFLKFFLILYLQMCFKCTFHLLELIFGCDVFYHEVNICNIPIRKMRFNTLKIVVIECVSVSLT